MNIPGMKTTPEPATVLLVGGGSVIAPTELDGVGGEHHRQWLHKIKTEIQLELIRPPFFSCANAVGACVANVAGEIGELFPSLIIARVNLNNVHNLADTIEILKDLDLSTVLERCKAEAMKRAVQAGAKPDTVKVVEIENLPVQVGRFSFSMAVCCARLIVPLQISEQYVTNKATRIIVKAVGEVRATIHTISMQIIYYTPSLLFFKLDPTSATGAGSLEVPAEYLDEDEGEKPEPESEAVDRVDIEHYTPYINEKGEWILSELDLGTKRV